MIPQNMSREHILRALRQIDEEGVPDTRQSKKYCLIYEERHYPPKYVVSLANRFANGELLDWTQFNGGRETNDFLQARSFMVTGCAKKREDLVDGALIQQRKGEPSRPFRDYLDARSKRSRR